MELRIASPLLDLHIFRDRGFAVENVVLATMSIVFVPFFLFASVYAQAALRRQRLERRPLHHVSSSSAS